MWTADNTSPPDPPLPGGNGLVRHYGCLPQLAAVVFAALALSIFCK